MNPQDIPLEELLKEQERRRMASQTQSAQLSQRPQQPQQPNIHSLLQQAQPQGFGNKLLAGLQNAARTGAEMTTGVKQPDAYGGGSDLYKTYMEKILGEQAKNLYADPRDTSIKDLRIKNLQAGLDYDEEGNPIKAVNPQMVEREKRMKAFEGRRQAGTLRGELNQNQYIKRFQEMNSAARGIDAMLSDTLSRTDNQSKNVGDQALITLYNKILDPLSVVRESEYARTPDGQSLLNRIAGFTQKVQSGGSGLTDADRVEIARAAKVLINNSGEMYNSKLDEYGNLADTYEVDPQMVLGGFERFSPYQVDQQQYGNSQPTEIVGQPQPAEQTNQGVVPSVGGMFNGQRVKKVTKIG